MSDAALIESLETMFRQVNTAIYKYGRSILAGMQVSALQFNALLTLKEFGSLTMGELSKQLFTACSTATDLADRLERAGFVERVRSHQDRRVVSVNLLPKGEGIVDLVITERQVFLGEILKQYTEPEQISLRNALEILTKRIEKADLAMQSK
ncbi:MAG: MarR family transcriptional regulator [Desulfitobacteriaceae bacterium]|nr:MarR family transcriptional regulator [Desulfitobacteriaceae bacterium]MDD4345909.1 MarR family transcriptional regulator [Desulfitobacteriaceae bacterium]MDD4402115.1 MarR family transcriptional regulator [Desulfitobacteriaceae bacterium]